MILFCAHSLFFGGLEALGTVVLEAETGIDVEGHEVDHRAVVPGNISTVYSPSFKTVNTTSFALSIKFKTSFNRLYRSRYNNDGVTHASYNDLLN